MDQFTQAEKLLNQFDKINKFGGKYKVTPYAELRNLLEQIQRELGIDHNFNEIYQEDSDKKRIEIYRTRFQQYAITVLANKELGDPKESDTIKRKINLLEAVSINPNEAFHIVNSYQQKYDLEGDLSPEVVIELRYCVQTVKRAFKEFTKRGRSYDDPVGRNIIDSALLHGFWTPSSYVHHARLVAEGKINCE